MAHLSKSTSDNNQVEVQRLRDAMRDLVALSTLPAVWAGYTPEGVVQSFAGVLRESLALDLVYIQADGIGDAKFACGDGFTPDAEQLRMIAEGLAPLMSSHPPLTVNNPLGNGLFHAAVARFGHTGDLGVVVACSRRPEFPTETDRVLLGVGTNQAAIVLQRKRAERALAEEREWLRVTLSSIGDAVIATNADGNVAFMNSVAESLTGWPIFEATGRPLSEVFDIVDQQTRQRRDYLAHRVQTNSESPSQTILISRDGTERPIDESAAPIREGADRPTGTVLVFRDVTARHQEERLRHAGEERLSTALAAARMVAWEWTPSDRKLRVSETAAEVFGLPNGVGLTGIDQGLALVHPDDVEMYEATYRDAIARRGSYQLYYRLIRPTDGRTIWIEERGNTVFDQPDGGVRLFGVATDVTDRRRVEDEAGRMAEKLRLALDAADLGTWEWNPATDEMIASDRTSEMYGIAPGVPYSREWGRHLLHPDDQQRAREAAQRAMAEKRDYSIEYRLAHRPMWVAAHGRGVYDAAGNLVRMHGVVQDVSERKRAELELRDADRKKDDFIALLAHELRNPLAPIRNGLEVLRLSDGDALAAGKARDMMDRQLTHMVRLIDDLLDVSRIGRNKMELRRERISLAEVVNTAVEASQPAIDAAGHELIISLPHDPVFLDADLTRLAQVFSNLLTNSAKYTARGGKIWLTATKVLDAVTVEVRDTGIGIPQAALPNIFDMFSQVDRSIERITGGLGIGLALVKGLTEMHGGTVIAASDSSGSTFTVNLPVLTDRTLEPVARPNAPIASGKGKRILVADDNRDGAESLSMMLTLLGNTVRTAHDGIQAITVAEAFRPELILMDVGMPRLNGYEATRAIRNQAWGNDIKIVALTGWGQDGDRELSRQSGCNGHLVKPVSLVELETVLIGAPFGANQIEAD